MAKINGDAMLSKLKYILVISLLAFGATFASASLSSAETRIASWNVKRMTASNKDMGAIAQIVSHFDLVALQEVMDEESLQDLVDRLQRSTGSSWGVMPSHAIGRGTYKERYAFLWRKSHIEYVDSAIVFLDHRDVFAREPMSARFRSREDDFDFIFSSIHVLYGDSKSDRIPEILALRDYWQWLGETYPGEQFFLAGDFNMLPSDPSYGGLRRFASPVVTEGATTLSRTDGKFANLYDNIWVPSNIRADLSSGILDFPRVLGISHADARKTVSDHAPVYLRIHSLDEATGTFDRRLAGTVGQAKMPEDMVRANKSSKIYHLPNCPNYSSLKKSKNLIEFSIENEAIEAGFRIAKNCKSANLIGN